MNTVQILWLNRWAWGNRCATLRSVAGQHHATLSSGGLTDLRLEMEAADCALKHRARLVFGSGNTHKPTVMIIGEAPGEEEDRQGLPFVGRSGQLLDMMLQAIDLDRKDLYITNTVPWRPPANRTPTVEEVATMLPYVLRHIDIIQPKILLLLGSTAARALLQNAQSPMYQITDKWYDVNGVQTIATYHPSYLLRSPGKKRETWKTLVKLRCWLDEMQIAE